MKKLIWGLPIILTILTIVLIGWPFIRLMLWLFFGVKTEGEYLDRMFLSTMIGLVFIPACGGTYVLVSEVSRE